MDIIKSSTEISNLFSQGRRIHTHYFTIIVTPHNDRANNSSGRVAFIAGKKLGNAVWRNGAKRRMREVCRQAGGPLDGFDVIFLAKRRICSAGYLEVVCACEKVFDELRSMKEKESF